MQQMLIIQILICFCFVYFFNRTEVLQNFWKPDGQFILKTMVAKELNGVTESGWYSKEYLGNIPNKVVQVSIY